MAAMVAPAAGPRAATTLPVAGNALITVLKQYDQISGSNTTFDEQISGSNNTIDENSKCNSKNKNIN